MGKKIQRQNRFSQMINHRLKITLQDGRWIIGQLLSFDKHMNLVLKDAEEHRITKGRTTVPFEQKRTLGMLVVRGENVEMLSVEGGPIPTSDNKTRMPGSSLIGPGIGRAGIGRGISGNNMGGMNMGGPGLTGPVRGIGGPAHNPIMGMGAVVTAPAVSYVNTGIPGRGIPVPPAGPPPGFKPNMQPKPGNTFGPPGENKQ